MDDKTFLTFMIVLILVGIAAVSYVGLTSDKTPSNEVLVQRLVDTGNAQWVDRRFNRELVLVPLKEKL